MAYGMLLAVSGTAVAAAIFGSVALQYVVPTGDNIVTPLEQRCADVARQGYAIHSAYPDMMLDEIPVDDARLLIKLDEIWMGECVPRLPASVIIEIADGVERGAPMRGE